MLSPFPFFELRYESRRKASNSTLQPMYPWDPIFGNIRVLAALSERVPKDARQAEAFAVLSSEATGIDSCFYIDVWPFGFPMLVVISPELAVQACQTYDLPKPNALAPFIRPMAGGPSFFDTNGAEWKQGRGTFNHGFSAQAAIRHVPHIIEEAEVYVDVLRQHAEKGDTFSLDEITCNYVMDIIGNIAL